jgi:hypothetical protein
VLDVDGDGTAAGFTDGVLLLRWLFHLRGTMLAHGAVAPACTRCSAEEIETYLASMDGDLDVDGNGIEAALSDGLLMLRWLLGLHGQTLVASAVGRGCTRCTPETIESFLDALF